MTRHLTTAETAVPDDDAPAAECPHCGLPFRSERARALHVGERHRDEWTDAERDAYEDAVDDESAELWYYHFKVVFAIGVVHAVTVLAYMIVWG